MQNTSVPDFSVQFRATALHLDGGLVDFLKKKDRYAMMVWTRAAALH